MCVWVDDIKSAATKQSLYECDTLLSFGDVPSLVPSLRKRGGGVTWVQG